jgi:dTDP-4-dehydrorhamnose reductase
LKVLITGAGGQLGSALQATVPPDVELLAVDRKGLDVRSAVRLREVLGLWRPDLVINAAAYTSVDLAESEPSLAIELNAEAPARLAEVVAAIHGRLIHISTDFVFAGDRSEPYGVEAPTRPLSVYGQSKRQGEQAVLAALGQAATVVRTSWLYSARARNFVLTILRLLATRDSVDVVCDQVGSPTWSVSLSGAVWTIARRGDVGGVQHWCDDGIASWYDFAVAIQEEASERGLLERQVPIRPIRTCDYPTPARRPAYSVLDKRSTAAALGLGPVHWRTNLRRMLDELVRT